MSESDLEEMRAVCLEGREIAKYEFDKNRVREYFHKRKEWVSKNVREIIANGREEEGLKLIYEELMKKYGVRA